MVREEYKARGLSRYRSFMSAHYALASIVYCGMHAVNLSGGRYSAILSQKEETSSYDFFMEIMNPANANGIVTLKLPTMACVWNTNADIATSLSYYCSDYPVMPRIKIANGMFEMSSYTQREAITANSVPEVIARYAMVEYTGFPLCETGIGSIDFFCVLSDGGEEFIMPMFSITRRI